MVDDDELRDLQDGLSGRTFHPCRILFRGPERPDLGYQNERAEERTRCHPST